MTVFVTVFIKVIAFIIALLLECYHVNCWFYIDIFDVFTIRRCYYTTSLYIASIYSLYLFSYSSISPLFESITFHFSSSFGDFSMDCYFYCKNQIL